MLRKILAVIAGYVTLFVFVAVSFAVAFAGVGVDRAFRPGSFEPSAAWIAVSFVLGLAGAVIGGGVAMLVAREPGTIRVFAAIVLLLGLVLAVPLLLSDAPAEERSGDLSASEAAMKARQPAWVALVNPFVGALGILLGGRLAARPMRGRAP